LIVLILRKLQPMGKFYLILLCVFFLVCCKEKKASIQTVKSVHLHKAPDTTLIPIGLEGEMIRYGKELINKTNYYIGPDGIHGKYAGNKMTCTNCHLEGGTKPFAFNFFSTYGSYPQYRSRENAVLTIEQRVNNCVTRPLNGQPLPLDSKEMIAIVSYIKWLGTTIPLGQKVNGTGGGDLKLPDRAADPKKGELIYHAECAQCHGKNGEGKLSTDHSSYEFPPLWGENGYQSGSSMFRIIKAARFIKNNMPNGTTWENPKLSDEEALDVAAYINNYDKPRPGFMQSDYSDIRTKYIDYPFGPYDDPFTEKQHKYGPYHEIISYRKKNKLYLKY
jgi:thiosulfate dehydrogenase